MDDAVPFQRSNRRQQIVAVAGQHFQAGNTFGVKLGRQRLVARLLQHQDGPAADLEFVFDGDDELAVDRPQGLRLFVQSGVVLFGQGDLQDELLFASLVTSSAVAWPLTHNPLDDEAMRVGRPAWPAAGRRRRLLGGGEFILDIIQHREEIFDRADAGEHVGMGAPLDQLFELWPDPIDARTRCSALFVPAGSRKFGRVAGRRATGEQVKGDGPEGKHVRRLSHLAGSAMASGDM